VLVKNTNTGWKIYQNQIAKTISTLLKVDYRQDKAGKPIASAIK
jgi:hypothetical protein